MKTSRILQINLTVLVLFFSISSLSFSAAPSSQQLAAWQAFVVSQGGFWAPGWGDDGGLYGARGKLSATSVSPHANIALDIIEELKITFFITDVATELVFADSAKITLANGYSVTYTWNQKLNSFPVFGSKVSVRLNDQGQVDKIAATTANPTLPSDFVDTVLTTAQAISAARTHWDVDSTTAATARAGYVPANDTNFLIWAVTLDTLSLDQSANPVVNELLLISQSGEILVELPVQLNADGFGAYFPVTPLTTGPVAHFEDNWVRDFILDVEVPLFWPSNSISELRGKHSVLKDSNGNPFLALANNVHPVTEESVPFFAHFELFNASGGIPDIVQEEATDGANVYFHINNFAEGLIQRGYDGWYPIISTVRVASSASSSYRATDSTLRFTILAQFGQLDRSSARDATVILHEYTHSVTHYLLRGGNRDEPWEFSREFNINTKGADFLEAISDFMALSFLNETVAGKYASPIDFQRDITEFIPVGFPCGSGFAARHCNGRKLSTALWAIRDSLFLPFSNINDPAFTIEQAVLLMLQVFSVDNPGTAKSAAWPGLVHELARKLGLSHTLKYVQDVFLHWNYPAREEELEHPVINGPLTVLPDPFMLKNVVPASDVFQTTSIAGYSQDTDPNGTFLDYRWEAVHGTIDYSASSPPFQTGTYLSPVSASYPLYDTVTLILYDGLGATATSELQIEIGPPVPPGHGCQCGDVDASDRVNIADVTYLITRLFSAGAAPIPPPSGDVNGDARVNISDITYIITWLFEGGSNPACADPIVCPYVPSAPKLVSGGSDGGTLTDDISFAITPEVSGSKIINLSSLYDIQGLSLTLRSAPGARITVKSLYEDIDLYWSQNGDIVRIGIVDIYGKVYIPAGNRPLLQITGDFEIIASLASQMNRGLAPPFAPKLNNGNTVIKAHDFSFDQNYPNPFNPETNISFSLPSKELVIIEIHNILGQKVRTLVNRDFDAGKHTVFWNGTDDLGVSLASGIYLYSIRAGAFSAQRKMMILK